MRWGVVVVMAALVLPCRAQNETFAAQVLRVSGMAPGAGAAVDPEDEIDSGEIWLADVDAGKAVRVDKEGGYRSPVLAPDGAAVYALRWDAVVRIPRSGGNAEEVMPLEGATKLAGFASDGRLLLMIEGGEGSPVMVGFVSPENRKLKWLSIDENAEADRNALARLRGWERVYGDRTLVVERRTEGNRKWTDVFVRASGKDAVNVSRCEKATCGQGSLSPDGKTAVFIRSPQ